MHTSPYAPSLFEMIQANARLHPYDTAIVSPSGTLSFREFCVHIERVTRHLHTYDLPPGSRIASDVKNPYLAWLLHIALSRLGMVSVITPAPKLVSPVAVLVDKAGSGQGLREIEVKDAWMTAAADALPAFVEPPHAADADCAIVLSSGTTGLPKLAPFSYAQANERIRASIIAYRLSEATRLIVTVHMSTVGGLYLPPASWCAGGCVILSPHNGPGQLRFRPTTLFMSPAQLGELVGKIPGDRVPRNPPTVYVGGSALPRELNMATRLRLSPALVMVYGSTEVGTVTLAPAAHADARAGLTGYVMPPAEVDIVDEQGASLPRGATGEVRIRNPGQCDRYLDDPQASARGFRDGWFHPGDLGTLGAQGELAIVGRVDEVMNFNGVKIAPDRVEEALGTLVGVSDFAVFALKGPNGADPAIAVVVSSSAFSPEGVVAAFLEKFPRIRKPTVFQIASIPRNEMGKVMRSRLAAEALAPAAGDNTLH